KWRGLGCGWPRGRGATATVQDLLEALRGPGELSYRARHPDGVIDGGRNRSADPGDAAFPRSLDAERIERAGIVLAQDDRDLGGLAHRWHEVVRKGGRQRVAALIIGEFFQQRAAQAWGEAADDLPFHQRRIDGAPDIIGDDVVLDLNAAGLAVDLRHGEVDAVGVDLVLHVEPAFG